VEGRATQAVLDAVADALAVPRSRVLLRTGERSRDKLLTIVDPPADLPERVRALRDGATDEPGAGNVDASEASRAASRPKRAPGGRA